MSTAHGIVPPRPGDAGLMAAALAEAQAAIDHGDVPVGCVVARAGEIVASARNERERRGDPTAHAEILALRAAARALGRRVLDDCEVYVTLEPCPMCAGALVLARVRRLVYGPPDPRAGAALSLYNIVQDPRLNHRVELTTGVMAEEAADLLRRFFLGRRL